MGRRFLVLPLIALLVLPLQARASDDEVVQVIKKVWAAWAAKDLAIIEKYTADEFVEFGDHGPYRNVGKEAALAEAKNVLPMLEIASWSIREPIVQRYGDVAVCIYYWTVAGSFAGDGFNESGITTDVLVKKGGTWKAVASHSTHTMGG